MTLKDAIKSSLTILKQVMEEKLNATNIEVCFELLNSLSLNLTMKMSSTNHISRVSLTHIAAAVLSLHRSARVEIPCAGFMKAFS